MKTLGPVKLGLTFAGCFLGAGYVSGQELYQYFGSFGKNGYWGLLITIALMFVLGTLMMTVVRQAGVKEMDRLLVPRDIPRLRGFVGIIQTLFIFGVTVIVSAGIGALAEQMAGLPYAVGSAVFCVILAVLALKGVSGLVNILSATVPLLVIAAVIISVVALAGKGLEAMDFSSKPHTSPLLQNWLLSAVNYACYSLFCGIGILTPLSHMSPDGKTIVRGVACGSGILLAIACGILSALAVYPDAVNAQLPMLALSSALAPWLGGVYAVMLLAAMLGAALSSYVAITNYAVQKFALNRRSRNILIVVMAAVAWLCSLFGFGNLIGVVYPLCGYFGFVAMIVIIIRFFKQKKGQGRENS